MSTYSDNLKLELLTTGTQAGTWGNTTNTNLGTLVEQAIAGYASYACTGGTDTLTMAEGASSTARNMFIRLTGTGGGTLVVPGTSPNANTKLYYIQNATASGAVTVKVSGQTGVSVPNGVKTVLFCNGTDIIDATNYMSALTLGAALPTSSGGTGSTSASTGTGGVVLAAGPALTGVPTAPTASPGTNTTQIATTAFVAAAATSLSTIYPIGSIYTSTVSTNPNTLFGFGTWVAFGAGRVLLGDGGGYAAGATGGSADAITVSHTHTASFTGTALGTHDHYVGSNDSTAGFGSDAGNREFVQNYNAGNGPATYTNPISAGTPSGSVSVTSTGSSGTGANLQPYVVVYMWNRTA